MVINQSSSRSTGGRVSQVPQGVVLLSHREVEKMRQVGRLAAQLLDHLEPLVQPGVSTRALNDEAERWTRAHGATSAPLGYAPPGHPPFTGSICTSIGAVVCHGIPDPKRLLAPGEIINIDVTLLLNGYHGDTSRTFVVGDAPAPVRRLVEVTRECLMLGIAAAGPFGRVGDIGAAISEHARSNGYSVVREMGGHGIGRQLHAEPFISHHGRRGTGLRLRPGMAFTVEPMLNEGLPDVEVQADGWTVLTRDRRLSAQWEHTVVITEAGVEILTLP